LFWENLCAASESKVTDAKQVVAEIEKQWGGIEEFKDRFWENVFGYPREWVGMVGQR